MTADETAEGLEQELLRAKVHEPIENPKFPQEPKGASPGGRDHSG